MTNNSGDMTNNISDERLKELIKTNDKESRFGRNGYYADIGNALAELLSARETIRQLVENSKALAGNTQSLMNNLPDSELDIAREVWGNTNVSVVWHWKEECRKSIEEHVALLAELEGNGFDVAMKRVVDENAGAWKALGGEEGKG